MDVEQKLKKLLLPVLGLESVDDIKGEQSLVNDLGADSLDFVELVFKIEKEFKIKIETKEIVTGGKKYSEDELFDEGLLRSEGLKILKGNFPYKPERFKVNMSKVEIFQLITVKDIANIIEQKLEKRRK